MKGKGNMMPKVIGGMSGDKAISEMLAKKFGTLNNYVGYDPDRIKMVENSVHNVIEENVNDDIIEVLINIKDLNNVIKQIKSNKSDGYLGLYTDHIINGTDKMYGLLVKLYNGMLTHGLGSGLQLGLGLRLGLGFIKPL